MLSPSQPSAREPQLDFPFAEPHAGTLREVARGVYWVRMPLPLALDHINLWLLRDGAGWTIVDCGFATEEARSLWERVFTRHLEGRPVTRLIATHFHPDHIGLAAWLCEKFDLAPTMTKSEYLLAHAAFNAVAGAARADVLALSRCHGLDEAALAGMGLPESGYRRGVPALPHAFQRIKDGDAVAVDGRLWRVMVGYGHSPEHAALYCKALGAMIAGDMVLPRISTHVGVWPMEPEGDPLAEFLDSLARYATLPADTLVLPSHGKVFRGLRTRVAELRAHHEKRLAALLAACHRPRSAAELLPTLFHRKLDGPHLLFAMGEAIAHLNHLMHRRLLKRVAGEDGVYRFVRIAERSL